MQLIAEQAPLKVIELSTERSPRRASVFLMNSDLSTGGTERQFSVMAKALRNGPFDLHLGCMRRRGAFLEGLEHIAEFDVAGSFDSQGTLRPSSIKATPSRAGRCGCPCLRLLRQSDVDSRCSIGTRSGGYWEPASTWGFA